MPGFDGSGPMGAGPMTGGARGLCNPAGAGVAPGYRGAIPYGRGMGFRRGYGARGGFGGMGRGRGFGRGYGWPVAASGPYVPPQPADELASLKAEADYLQKSLEAINSRIGELQNAGSAPA